MAQRPDQLIRMIAETCERLKLEYFITGSIASMYYGEPRFTRDVDVVVELPSWKVREFCAAFPSPGYYSDERVAMEAAQRCDQFNIIDNSSGMKADILIFKDTPFDNSRASRRRLVSITPEISAYIASPEDVILKKLEFYRAGGSDKHLRDIAAMVRVGRTPIDVAYLDHWALRIGVQDEWRMIQERLKSAGQDP